MRPFNENRTWGDKQKKVYHYDADGNKIYDPKKRQYKCNKIQTTDWNEQSRAEDWRAAWADMINGVLEHSGHAARVDHRSFERQGIDQVPTIHLGAAASQMEKCGIRTKRGDINREIEISNQRLREIKARLVKLQTWLKEEMQNTEPPTFADIVSNILSRRQGNYNTASGLKQASNIVNFLTANSISDMAGLETHVKAMMGKRAAIRDELKAIEKRATVLDEHIRHSGNYKSYYKYKAQYEKLYAEYQSIKKAGGFGAGRKAQKALDTANDYYESNRMEIVLFESAERYLKDVLQERFDPTKLPPITKWKAEREKLNGDLSRLSFQYTTLRDETAAVEKIKRNIDDILNDGTPTRQRKRTHDHDR
jgi:hypothetical protein